MANFKLKSSYKKNGELPFSVGDLKDRYFFGIAIKDPDGNLLSDESIEFYIKNAVKQLETDLDIKINLQVIEETKHFNWENYTNWTYVRASYPVNCVESLNGFVGQVRQVIFPPDWISINKSNDTDVRHRTVNIVPTTNQSGQVTQSVVYAGIYPQLGYFGNRNIPNYWVLTYATGFRELPSDLAQVIGMKAAIPIFDLLGDLVIGAGIASQSLGIDGLSQSVSTTSSAENSAYSARIKSYQATIKEMMPHLKKKYTGFVFGAA